MSKQTGGRGFWTGPKGPVIPAFQGDPRQYLQAMLPVRSPKREDWGGWELSNQSHVNKIQFRSIMVRGIKESDLTDRWCWAWDVVG